MLNNNLKIIFVHKEHPEHWIHAAFPSKEHALITDEVKYQLKRKMFSDFRVAPQAPGSGNLIASISLLLPKAIGSM